MGGKVYVGIDLAWSSGVTGLAAVDEAGDLVAATERRTDAEILEWLRPWTGGACLVGIDAPIVVRNAAGSRACEKLTGRYFGRYGASCHPANTTRPAFRDGTRALRLTEELELDIDPDSPAGRQAIEVYPHPAIVALFGLPMIVRYKSKPGRSLEFLRAETRRLLELLEGLAGDPVPLRAVSCRAWGGIRHGVEVAGTKAALVRLQDSIDAVVCAYIAMLADRCPERVRTLGTAQDGYIVTPVTPELAARIDADRIGPDWIGPDGIGSKHGLGDPL